MFPAGVSYLGDERAATAVLEEAMSFVTSAQLSKRSLGLNNYAQSFPLSNGGIIHVNDMEYLRTAVIDVRGISPESEPAEGVRNRLEYPAHILCVPTSVESPLGLTRVPDAALAFDSARTVDELELSQNGSPTPPKLSRTSLSLYGYDKPRAMMPGNMDWSDRRPRSAGDPLEENEHYGLVLTWWMPYATRYGKQAVSPGPGFVEALSSTGGFLGPSARGAFPEPYEGSAIIDLSSREGLRFLWCNSILVAAVPVGQAIVGACLSMKPPPPDSKESGKYRVVRVLAVNAPEGEIPVASQGVLYWYESPFGGVPRRGQKVIRLLPKPGQYWEFPYSSTGVFIGSFANRVPPIHCNSSGTKAVMVLTSSSPESAELPSIVELDIASGDAWQLERVVGSPATAVGQDGAVGSTTADGGLQAQYASLVESFTVHAVDYERDEPVWVHSHKIVETTVDSSWTQSGTTLFADEIKIKNRTTRSVFAVRDISVEFQLTHSKYGTLYGQESSSSEEANSSWVEERTIYLTNTNNFDGDEGVNLLHGSFSLGGNVTSAWDVGTFSGDLRVGEFRVPVLRQRTTKSAAFGSGSYTQSAGYGGSVSVGTSTSEQHYVEVGRLGGVLQVGDEIQFGETEGGEIVYPPAGVGRRLDSGWEADIPASDLLSYLGDVVTAYIRWFDAPYTYLEDRTRYTSQAVGDQSIAANGSTSSYDSSMFFESYIRPLPGSIFHVNYIRGMPSPNNPAGGAYVLGLETTALTKVQGALSGITGVLFLGPFEEEIN